MKGYIYEMAMRLEDEDERISSLAKLFFLELSKKGKMPDWDSMSTTQYYVYCTLIEI